MPALKPTFPEQQQPPAGALRTATITALDGQQHTIVVGTTSGQPLGPEYTIEHTEINELRAAGINHADLIDDHADRIDELEAGNTGGTGGVAAFGELIGDGIQSVFTVRHDRGTTDYSVTVAKVQGDTEETVGVRVQRKANTVIVGPFHAAPNVNAYRVTVE